MGDFIQVLPCFQISAIWAHCVGYTWLPSNDASGCLRWCGKIASYFTSSAFEALVNQFFKSTLYVHLGSFMQICWILRKFIRPHIRPDIRIVTKISRDIFWHRNMNSWKSHVVSYYCFWVIVWTNIHTKISNPDIRPDVRSDNRIEFKLSPVL